MIPLQGKDPIGSLVPNGVLDCTTDPEQIRDWWHTVPGANIGIAVPDDSVVIDVDPRNGGGETFDAWQAEHGAVLNGTLVAATGGGGAHFWYQAPAGGKMPGKLRGQKGIDVLSVGKYVIAPPSIHPGDPKHGIEPGGVYEWENYGTAKPAPLPPFLAKYVRKVSEVSVTVSAADDRDLTPEECEQLDAVAELLEPHAELGNRNALALAVGGFLRNSGMPPSAARHVVEQLPSDDTEARVADALRAWNAERAVGWEALADIVPSDDMAELSALRVQPSARKSVLDKWQERRAQREAQDKPEEPPDGSHWAAKFGTLADRTRSPEPLDYIVDGLPIAPGGKVNALTGAPNAGKSPWAVWLALSVAAASLPDSPVVNFLGRKILKPGPVLYVDCETGVLAEIRDRRMCNALGFDTPEQRASVPLEFVHLESVLTEEFAAALDARLNDDSGTVLCVLDTYAGALGADIDHNSPQFASWLRVLGRISRSSGVAILVLLHERKRQEGKRKGSALEMTAGSFQAPGAMQSAVSLYRPEDEDPELVAVHCARAPEKGFTTFAVRWSDVAKPSKAERKRGGIGDAALSADWGLRVDVVEAELAGNLPGTKQEDEDKLTAEDILKCLGRTGGLTQTEIRMQAYGGHARIKNMLLKLEREGLVVSTTTPVVGKKTTPRYSLAPRTKANAQAWLRHGTPVQKKLSENS